MHGAPERAAGRWRLVTLLALSCLAGLVTALAAAQPETPATALVEQGWRQFLNNQNLASLASFRAAVRRDPSRAEAYRGLGLVLLQEDDELGALHAWRPLFRLAPGHWAATAYWARYVELAHNAGRYDLLASAARDLIRAKGVPVALRAAARQAAAVAAERRGQPAAAAAHWAALGYLRDWRVIGPFDNVSGSGYEKQFPPEQGIDFARSHAGKNHLPRRWHRLQLVARDGGCAISLALGEDPESVYYAATALFSIRDQPVVLRYDATVASKIWLNGHPVFASQRHPGNRPQMSDAFAIPADLRSGWNILLVKLAAEEEPLALFTFRFTGPKAETLSGLRSDSARANAPALLAAAAPAPAPVETTGVAALRQAASVESMDAAIEVRVALAAQLRGAGDLPRAIAVLRAAVDQAPETGWLRWELSQALAADGQEDEARAARDAALARNPRLAGAAMDRMHEDRSLLPAQRLEQLRTLRHRHPGSARVCLELGQAFTEAGMKREALDLAAAAAAGRGPEVQGELAVILDLAGRETEAGRVLATALRAAPRSPQLLLELAERLVERGRSAEAIPVYRRLIATAPTSPPYRVALADLYRGRGDIEEAEKILRVVRRHQPQNAEVCAQLGAVRLEAGDRRGAVAAYRAAVRLDPADLFVRNRLEALAGEASPLDLAPPTPVEPLLAGGSGSQRGASAVVLLDEMREVVYPDYATSSRHRHVVKVLDAAGVSRFQSHDLDVPSGFALPRVESARLIKPDGTVQKVDSGYSPGSVSFPALAPGDILDVAYRVDSGPSGGLARHFWTQWFFSEPNAPVRLSRYVLITPRGFEFRTRAHGEVPEPKVTDVQGWRVREWRLTDVPAHRSEPWGTSLVDSGTWLDLSTVKSWSEIAQWYADLSRPRCVPDEAARAMAARLTRDAATEREKVQVLVRFVAREIRYQSTPFRMSAYIPTAGKQVLRERYGDCKDKAALLCSLLGAIGIPAHMVLLSGRSDGIAALLPSPRFSHAVVRVGTAGGPVWVDATAHQLEAAGFPTENQDVPALIIDPATADLTVTPALPIESSVNEDIHDCQLDSEGRLVGAAELTGSGNFAWAYRAVLQETPEGDREESLRRWAMQFVPGSRYRGGELDNLEDPDRPFVFRYRYHIERHGVTAGSFLLVRIPWYELDDGEVQTLVERPAGLRDLETANQRGQYVSIVRLRLPPGGYLPVELRPEVARESRWGSYRVTYRMEGDTLVAARSLTLTALRVPAAELAGYAAFLDDLSRDSGAPLVFRRPE